MEQAKESKKARKKREREDNLEAKREERERKKRARQEHPSWPLISFCKNLGDFPWSNASNHWEFKEDSKEFKLLSTIVPAPNSQIRTIKGLHASYDDRSCAYEADFSNGEASEVVLPAKCTYGDVANAVHESAIEQGAGGHICNVIDVDLSKDDPTVLEVKFDIYCFSED